ncbi:MAG TPA: glutathione-dependent reductase, partial [Proteobacteria bacterium]|nr:glutathione-dependent reductase [Pseudomonadota bacterium]
QLYQQAKKNLNTRVTVPVLWDKQTKTIVNNESSQIIRIFNSEFNTLTANNHNYYPDALKKSIDQWNQQNYDAINNGVYKAGFAVTQSAYDDAVEKIYTQLDRCDSHLQDHQYLCGSTFTEADIRLIPTLLRFDLVYHTHFKCTLKRIIDYKGLSAYLSRCRSIAAVAKTTNDWHIKRHYYYS